MKMQITICDKCGKEIKNNTNKYYEYYLIHFDQCVAGFGGEAKLDGNGYELCQECAMETLDFIKKGKKHNELDKA